MGYHPVDKVQLERVYSPERKLIARIWRDETRAWAEECFPYDCVREALAWLEAKMNEKCM